MSTSPIVPCMWLDDQAEAAATFYVEALPGGRILSKSRYPEAFDNPAHQPRGAILTVELEAGGQRFTALNGGPAFKPTPAVSFFVHTATPGEAERTFGKLLQGGDVLMPMGAYPWSERYGWAKDRFGVTWQVMAGPRPAGTATVVPCLMFTGKNAGRAAEAMRLYEGIFPGSGVDAVERFAQGEGPTDSVKHARFHLAGQEMSAMDSHVDHGFTFNEALSLQVMCRDQAEIDRYWAALSDGGKEGPCSWLQDRYGLSWQIASEEMAGWLTSSDTAARDRTFQAMLKMSKLDIATLRRAFDGA